MNATDKMKYAILRMMMGGAETVFYGTLVGHLKEIRANEHIKSMRTNGSILEYNPEYVGHDMNTGLSIDQIHYVLAHEMLHIALSHHYRRGWRELGMWNKACDMALDPLLADTKLPPPPEVNQKIKMVVDGQSAEEIYTILEQMPPGDGNAQKPGGGGAGGKKQDGGGKNQQQEPGQGNNPAVGNGQGDDQQNGPSDNGCGEIVDAPDDTDENEDAARWQRAIDQATEAAKSRGDLPGALQRLIDARKEAQIDWRAATQKFVRDCAPTDYSWQKPNPSYLHIPWTDASGKPRRGIYMPRLDEPRMGPMGLCIDTSGSIGKDELDQYGGEMTDILNSVRPTVLIVVYCDADVQRVDKFYPGDTVTLDAVGGGGTDFIPAIDYLKEQDEPMACAIYLTDGDGRFPDVAPEFPMMWAITTNVVAPFGETIPLRF